MKSGYLALVLAGLASLGSLSCSKNPVAPLPEAPVTRHYYISADEVNWDYAPSGINQITGQSFGDQENTFVQRGPDRIGSVYLKALYREYTDATFSTLKPVPEAWKHLGCMGPLVRGVVGDSIVIVFRNNTQISATIHAHGIKYDKGSEGAPYADSTSGDAKEDDNVLPGTRRTFRYFVPERSGPGPMDGSSVMWMYHSHYDEVKDTYSGLIGAILITARGKARADGSPADVDREFVTMFHIFNENNSWFIDRNIQAFAQDPGSVNPDDPDFQESNLMHSINGYVYGNLPGLNMRRGEHVRWYLMGMATEVDLHTPHWHGQTAQMNGMQTDVVELLPGTMVVADMVPDNPGTWLFHCHVNDHITAGMMAVFHVDP